MESVEKAVVSLIQASLPGAADRTITPDLDLITDLGADSLSLVSLIFSLDEKFGTGTEEMGTLVQQCRTVGDLIEVTERQRAGQGSA